jgi:hypothetical protein
MAMDTDMDIDIDMAKAIDDYRIGGKLGSSYTKVRNYMYINHVCDSAEFAL